MSRMQVLLLLCALLLVAVWYSWKETPRQQRADNRKAVVRDAVSPAGTTAVTKTDSLDFSGGEELTFKKPKRDLFRSLYRAPAVKTRVAAPPKPAPVVAPPPPPPPIAVQESFASPAAGRPLPYLEILGFLRKGPTVTAFLATPRGDLYLVKKGSRFADGLVVRELDSSKIVISRAQSEQSVTLTIREKKTQTMSIPNVPSGRPNVPAYVSPEPVSKKSGKESEEGEPEQ